MIVSNIHDNTDCILNIQPNSGYFPYKDITLQSCLLVLGMNDPYIRLKHLSLLGLRDPSRVRDGGHVH